MFEEKVIKRFWSFVEKTPTCWKWRTVQGHYVQFSVKGNQVLAHHFSFILKHGSIPEGMIVHHKCGMPTCVRPFHLEAITQKENLSKARCGISIPSNGPSNDPKDYASPDECLQILKDAGVDRSHTWLRSKLISEKIRSKKFSYSRAIYRLDIMKMIKKEKRK